MDTKLYLEALFAKNNIDISEKQKVLFANFSDEEEMVAIVNQIEQLQNLLMDKYKYRELLQCISEEQIILPNATVGKIYSAKIDLSKPYLKEIIHFEFSNLEQYGLSFDTSKNELSGIPTQSGDFRVEIKYRVESELENSELNSKTLNLVINADPKSLWKTLDSDKTAAFWKEDNDSIFAPLGDKHIVASSKRGRSHANVGSFREDHFGFKHLEQSGWSIVTVSDGAGSAKLSRKGSQMACDEVISYFQKAFTAEITQAFDELAEDYFNESNLVLQETITPEEAEIELMNNKVDDLMELANPDQADIEILAEEVQAAIPEPKKTNFAGEISKFIYNHLGSAAKTAHDKLAEFALLNEHELKDFHATLIFALYKKYDFGYVVMSFGVGDCPIGLIDKDNNLKLMNWLDVGEYGGGTRFITMPEIFQSDKFSTRFGFKLLPDFKYLMLMTDGIYDPKFVVEANLEKSEKWDEFIEDLKGVNEDKISVDLHSDNLEIASQLSSWMDFWSPGNHDDRTLAIIF
jgi:serine/threonine protein phosphatase PrpC